MAGPAIVEQERREAAERMGLDPDDPDVALKME